MAALAMGLSIVFGGVVLLLLAELFYVFVWKRNGDLNKGVRRLGTECNTGIGTFAHEAALVGSFGGYSTSSVDTQSVAKLFPMGPAAQDRDTMFMDGMVGDPRLLFTIKEETEEGMAFEKPAKQHKESAASFVQTLQSESRKQPSESPFPKQRRLLQNQFPRSIEVFKQPQILRSISKKLSWTPTAMQQHNVLQGPSDLSIQSSCNLPSSPPHPPPLSSPSSPTSASISPSLTSPKHQPFCSSDSSSPELFCVSKSVYDLDSNEVSCNTQPNVFSKESENENEAPCNIQYSGCSSPQEILLTPFDTPISSPCLLTPCGSPPMTPPLTPIRASKDSSGISIQMANYRSGTSYISSAESDPLFAS